MKVKVSLPPILRQIMLVSLLGDVAAFSACFSIGCAVGCGYVLRGTVPADRFSAMPISAQHAFLWHIAGCVGFAALVAAAAILMVRVLGAILEKEAQ